MPFLVTLNLGITWVRSRYDQRVKTDVRDRQVQVFRAMRPEEKLRAIECLYWSARRLKEAGVRQRHPDWSESEVRRSVSDAFLYRRD